MGAFTALRSAFGQILAVAVIGAWLAVMWRGFGPGRALVTFSAIGAGYWVLIAIARGPALEPEEVRYVYVSAELAAIIVISLIPAPAARPSTRQFAFVGAIAAFALFAQMQGYRTEAANYRETSALTLADVFAIKTAASVVKPDFIAPDGDPQLRAASYLNASRFWATPRGLASNRSAPATRSCAITSTRHCLRLFGLAVNPLPSLRGVRLAALGRPALVGPGPAAPDGRIAGR
jgi:hypothetical protein